MKIALITLHRVANFGSVLQTYALQEFLESGGNDVEVIDYYPERLRWKKILFEVNPKWSKPLIKKVIFLSAAITAKGTMMLVTNKFLKKYLNMTKTYYTFEDLQNDVPKADIYFNGSDQIWNTDTADGLIDKSFYLDFVPENFLRISYAGSFGKTNFSDNEKLEISKLIKKYSEISVREEQALGVLESMGRSDATLVLDPTFLLTKNQWERIGSPKRYKDNYLLIYNLNRNPKVNKYAMQIAKKKNLKIINIAPTYNFISAAKNIVFLTPNDYISLFYNAEYVVTDSFHGTAFSLNFNKNFISVPAPRFNSRLESILELTNLKERFVDGDLNLEIALKEINYNKINKIIERERNKSAQFINRALNKVDNVERCYINDKC